MHPMSRCFSASTVLPLQISPNLLGSNAEVASKTTASQERRDCFCLHTEAATTSGMNPLCDCLSHVYCDGSKISMPRSEMRLRPVNPRLLLLGTKYKLCILVCAGNRRVACHTRVRKRAAESAIQFACTLKSMRFALRHVPPDYTLNK